MRLDRAWTGSLGNKESVLFIGQKGELVFRLPFKEESLK